MYEHPIRWESRRSPVLSTRGAVATSQPLATLAGVTVLQAGGNAADAAVAAAAALAVVEPGSTGVGGDCFSLFRRASDGAVEAVNGSGRSPRELTPEAAGGPGGFDPRGPHSVTVPGSVAGWADTVGAVRAHAPGRGAGARRRPGRGRLSGHPDHRRGLAEPGGAAQAPGSRRIGPPARRARSPPGRSLAQPGHRRRAARRGRGRSRRLLPGGPGAGHRRGVGGPRGVHDRR